MKQIYSLIIFLPICLFFKQPIFAQYCTPSVSNTSFVYFTDVSFSNINNSNQAPAFDPATGIQDYTTQTATLVQGIAATLSTSITTYSPYDHRVYAYIDWDQDNDFEDEVGQPYILAAAATTAGPHSISITPPAGALLGTTRMRLVVDANEDPASCGRASDGAAIWIGEYEDYSINLIPPGPLTYTSSTTTQEDTSYANYCENNQQIIGLQIETGGAGTTGSLDLTQVQLNMNGSTRISDATAIHIYYTGSSDTFATNNLFATIAPGGGTLIANGNQSLVQGLNYFWVAYDMTTAYVSADTVDAECTRITVGGINYTPLITDPGTGKITVSCPFSGDCAVPFTPSYCSNEIQGNVQWIENVTVGSINNTTVHDGYGNYTNLSTNMTAGLAYTINVRANFTWSGSGLGIYADWNKDGDFNDPQEIILQNNTIVPPNRTWTATITPPTTAYNGDIRLRIVDSYTPNLPLNPCGGSVSANGDVEDYTIQLTGAINTPALPYLPDGIAPPFTNGDFSTGDLTGWTVSSGFHPTGGNFQGTYAGGCCDDPWAQALIMTAADPNDTCGGFPVVPPSGTHSLLLGDANVGAEADRIRQTFQVDSLNSTLTYHYAIVMNEPGHNALDQPVFTVRLRDANGCDLLCANYSATSGYDNTGFVPSACGGEYLDWQSRQVDLYQYLGKDITIEFTMTDCAQGAHYGYAYIAVTTAPTVIPQDSICIAPGDSVTLTAPVGYHNYLWSTTDTSLSILETPHVTTYYNVIASNDRGCANQINFAVSTDCVILLEGELLQFSAKANEQNTVDLQWQIDQVNDIDYFILERSWDGIIFKPFATKAQDGTTIYDHEDAAPLAGTSYYRLKIMKINGQAAFSKIQSVTIDLNHGINVFPNPARNEFTIQGEQLQNATIIIHNSMGQLIQKMPIQADTKATFFAGDLAKGLYLVSIMVDGIKAKTVKLIID